MARKLKIWNGRGWRQCRPENPKEGVEHCFVAAYSRADAVRLINQAAGYRAVSDRELRHCPGTYQPAWTENTTGPTTAQTGDFWLTSTA